MTIRLTKDEYVVLRYAPGHLLGTYSPDSHVHSFLACGYLQACYEGFLGVILRAPTIRLTDRGIAALIEFHRPLPPLEDY